MIEFLIPYGWDIFKVIMSTSGGLAIWSVQRLFTRMNKQDARITELEKNQAVYEARYDQWIEFGKPERRRW